MIRKLSENDRKQVLQFLSEEAAINLFIIGDIENFGFKKDFMDLWGSFNNEEEIEGVLLRYHESFIPYYKNSNFDVAGFKEIINKYEGKKIISGKNNIVDDFKDIVQGAKEKSTYFCELKNKEKLIKDYGNILTAKVSDSKKIYDLLETIDEFNATDTNSLERIENGITTKAGRIYFMKNEYGEAITTAQTTAENKYSAMVVSVATRKEYRGKGLMGQCLSKLCSDLLNEDKTLCLFYDNPEAGKVYHRIGFETIGKWKMLIKL
ncbi:GNAT family N-acetyltransferase [Clostridium sediminicola]|uniref:GNAT family N-acetyltransferase n=1 Tax=Clostridium sediminicola TaxID=3114879 RepID=UPI0031F24C57